MILTLGVVAGRILYSQLGAYLLYEDIHARIDTLGDMAEHIAAAHQTPLRGANEQETENILAAQSHAVHDRELPGLTITFSDNSTPSCEKWRAARTPMPGSYRKRTSCRSRASAPCPGPILSE